MFFNKSNKMKKIILFVILCVLTIIVFIVLAVTPTVTTVKIENGNLGNNITCNATVPAGVIPIYKWYINSSEFTTYKKFFNGFLDYNYTINATSDGIIMYILVPSNVSYVSFIVENASLTSNPENLTISINNTIIFNNTGNLSKNVTQNFSKVVNDFLVNCPIQEILTNETGYCNIPLNFSSPTTGLVNISGLNMSISTLKWFEFGANQNITCEVTPFNGSDYGTAVNTTIYIPKSSVSVIFQPAGLSQIPVNVSVNTSSILNFTIIFNDKNKSMQNISGCIKNGGCQDSSTPILTIKNIQYMPVTILLNITNTPLLNVSIFANSNSNFSNASMINITPYVIVRRLPLNQIQNIFLWANFTSNISRTSVNLTFLLEPEICSFANAGILCLNFSYDVIAGIPTLKWRIKNNLGVNITGVSIFTFESDPSSPQIGSIACGNTAGGATKLIHGQEDNYIVECDTSLNNKINTNMVFTYTKQDSFGGGSIPHQIVGKLIYHLNNTPTSTSTNINTFNVPVLETTSREMCQIQGNILCNNLKIITTASTAQINIKNTNSFNLTNASINFTSQDLLSHTYSSDFSYQAEPSCR